MRESREEEGKDGWHPGALGEKEGSVKRRRVIFKRILIAYL
jgi:hypothetical protein